MSAIIRHFLFFTFVGIGILSGTGSGFYTQQQHFYLPTGMMFGGNNMFYERSIGRPYGPVPAAWKQQQQQPQLDGNNMPSTMEAEDGGEEQQQQPETGGMEADEKQPQQQQQQKPSSLALARNQAAKIPRRHLRHLLADEFATGRMGRQFKRMRPCFYSPIQCLMKRNGGAGYAYGNGGAAAMMES